MGEIVNLRRERKRRARDRAATEAAASRARHGRDRAAREAQARQDDHLRGVVDGARLDPPPDRND